MSDLNSFARGLLDFAAQSIQEGLENPSSLFECLSEADCAFRILKKRLRDEEQLTGQLALLRLFDSHVDLATNNPKDFHERLQKCAEVAQIAKGLFE